MSIVDKDLQHARRLVKSPKYANFAKNQAHRRHRRNQAALLKDVSADPEIANEDLDFVTKPATGWDVA